MQSHIDILDYRLKENKLISSDNSILYLKLIGYHGHKIFYLSFRPELFFLLINFF